MRVVVEGASGYSGQELLRLLIAHRRVEVVGASSNRWNGRRVDDCLGLPKQQAPLTFCANLDVEAELVFCATPADVSRRLVPDWRQRGARVIDLSDAFRADRHAIYGLTEYAREHIPAADLIANPGCYPTASQLAFKPLVDASLLAKGAPIVIDAKSGASGAGRANADAMLFNELADNHYPYKVGMHRHTAEIERGLASSVIFTPHLLPTRRGLLVSGYATVKSGVTIADVQDCLRQRYENERFVRVVETGSEIGIRWVVRTPICRIAVGPVIKNGVVCVFACLDNLMKGAASQALQNMNLMCGFDESDGL